MYTTDQLKLLIRLSDNWPENMKLAVEGEQVIPAADHPLIGELSAILDGTWASLPFFTPDKVAWFTMAPDIESLQLAIENMRAWILPSFGWENEPQSLVPPGESSGELSTLIHSMSPSGYYRWWTTRRDFNRVVSKLKTMRQLEASKPAYIYEHVPSLFELRQQYEVALMTGDRDAAQDAINSIDHHQLDSAVNTRFMQIRLWDQFREYQQIATDPRVDELVQLRMPHRIRLCIVRAFHTHFLAPDEGRGDLGAAAQSYAENVHDTLVGLIDLCRPSDGLEASRCLGYKAWLLKDEQRASRLIEETDDELLKQFLSPLQVQKAPQPAPDIQFFDALRRGDWRTLQEVGLELLETNSTTAIPLPTDYLLSALRSSLEFRPNPSLNEKLASFSPTEQEIPTIVPQTWTEFFESIGRRDWDCAGKFIAWHERPAIDSLRPTEIQFILEALKEQLTDPEVNRDPAGYQIIRSSLPALIKDFVNGPEFPRPDMAGLYLQLLQIWVEYNKGSAYAPYGNLLLTIADGVLQYSSEAEVEVAGAIRSWWEARKVRGMLPFLLESLALLSEFTSDQDACESLWIDGAEIVRRDPTAITPAERTLWRIIGGRIGLDESAIDEFLKIEAESEAATSDPITSANLRKIAIVSLREEAANIAAKLIRERTKAEVLVVTETVAGASTSNATTADVILFVWASSTHAVYRAFDGVREKVAYVQGTGAPGIVLALERWVIRQREVIA